MHKMSIVYSYSHLWKCFLSLHLKLFVLVCFQNILELTLYDKDVLISDELTSIVFDVGGMKPGQPLLRTFRLNPEVSPWLLPRSPLNSCSSLLQKSSSTWLLICLSCKNQKGKMHQQMMTTCMFLLTSEIFLKSLVIFVSVCVPQSLGFPVK